MAVTPVSPLDLDRYELKYIIPFAMVGPISDYVAQYCELDYYSQISPDGYYTINSLYLDTQSLYIARRMQGCEHDFSSFRIRSYGSHPKPPYYVESKQKMGDFCRKRRGQVPIKNLEDLFERPWSITEFDPYADKNVSEFMEKVNTFGMAPKILTQYRRKAYISRHDEYARVTFDRDMRYTEENDWNVLPDDSRMTHYDHPETFDWPDSGRNVVLEIKCERKIPLWMIQLIRGFELTRQGFSKYNFSLFEMQDSGTRMFAFDLQNKEDPKQLRYSFPNLA